jgi:hypothetical protein
MNEWIKQGLIYKPSGEWEWSRTHAQVPFAYLLNDNSTVRFFFATRNSAGQTGVGLLDAEAGNPKNILRVYDHPALQKGRQGCFDDSGTMPSWFVKDGNKLYMYYTGWNTSETAAYRLAIGLAVSEDDGVTFSRVYEGPVMDRNTHDPVWVGQPCVLREGNTWKMWYLSCEKIEMINNRPEPFYNVKYAESADGIHWVRNNQVCIPFDHFTDAIGRPCVHREGDVYKMYFSYRNANGYRTDAEKSYRVGYAESADGITWDMKPGMIDLRTVTGDWEKTMQEYCTRYEHNGTEYLVYNGDGFGASGFGYATRTL